MISASGSHVHSLPLPKPGGVVPLSHSRDKGRPQMDAQKFLIPTLPVSSRPDPNSAQKRRERSILNGTGSVTPSDSHMYSSHAHGQSHPHVQSHLHGMSPSTPTPYSSRSVASSYNGLSRGGYAAPLPTGLPPPTNSPRKDAHSPMYPHAHAHSHTPETDLQFQHHKNYMSQRSSVPIPCSSPARATSASPKSAPSAHSPSKSPYAPGGGLSEMLYAAAGFPHHVGASGHAAALYAAAHAAAAQPNPYSALFGVGVGVGAYPNPATAYLDNFHSSIMAAQQKSSGVGQGQRSTGTSHDPYYSPHPHAPHTTATTAFHHKLIDSALPIERLYNGHHHAHAHQYQSQGQNHERGQVHERSSGQIHKMSFPSLPNGVSVSLAKRSPGIRESQKVVSSASVTPQTNGSSIRYANARSNGGGEASVLPITSSQSSKFWNGDTTHAQAFKATSPTLLGKGEEPKAVTSGGKEGSLKHRILATRSPPPKFTFPNLSTGSSKKQEYHDHRPKVSGAWHGSGAENGQGRSPSPPFKYLSQIYKPAPSPTVVATGAGLPLTATSGHSVPTTSPRTPLTPANYKTVSNPMQSQPRPSTPLGVKLGTAVPVEEMPRLDAFVCGSLIQLAGGAVKAVEELRVEDFLQSAATATERLRIIHCTIVDIQGMGEKVNGGQEYCKVTLAMGGGAGNHQIVVDAKPEQPFFILGRGWSSWSPVKTAEVLQLPCTPLAVGDVCMTLSRPKKTLPPVVPKSPTVKVKNLSILSSHRTGIKRPIGVANGVQKSRSGTIIARKPLKGLEAQTMLPPPCPLTPRTISKISAVVDDKVKCQVNPPTATTTTRSTTPKKRRWSAPDVVDEDSGDVKLGVIRPPPPKKSLTPPTHIPITV